ncbi:efflux MFS transporter permease [Chitinophaga tropicalis]|uniref:MFS transporter n=1 Tax=Chitinophaga tropicalis TaxID=2683588 RepID=A0A7K1U517_9BACT|nr:hypothetical protein [Chitinophaga tropicalis]MVT09429.1 hypothetical protein [Chitinophaga tropicalis]
MELKDLFYKWVPVYIKLPVLFILIFAILVSNGIFLGNSNEAFSSLGEYSEPFTEAYNAMYIGMGLGLMIEMRLKLRFTNKTLLLWGLGVMLLMNVVCATTSNTTLMVVACFVTGMIKMSAMVEVYVIWMFIWSKKGDTARLYPFIYFTALAGLYFVTWATTKLAYYFNWRYAYLIICCLLLLCIVLSIVLVENHRLKKTLPLYRVDWSGLVLLATALMAFNHFVVWGKVEDWLHSGRMKLTLCLSLIALALFLLRQLHTRRPLVDLHLFTKRSFQVGLFYFFVMGIFFPATLQSAFSVSILQYEAHTNAALNLYLIPGVLVGAVCCFVWYYRGYDQRVLIFLGFSGFVLYHVIMYNSFGLRFTREDFVAPSLIKGFSTALIYIAVGLYTTRGFDLKNVIVAAGVMILVRSFLSSAVFTAIYNDVLYKQRIRHFNLLAAHLDTGADIIRQQGGAMSVFGDLQRQAILAASKEITGQIIIAGIVFLIVLIAACIYEQLKGGLKARS